MASATMVKGKIDILASSFIEVEQLIIAGTDEHLDLILRIQDMLKSMTAKSVAVNSVLEAEFNNLSRDLAKKLVIN